MMRNKAQQKYFFRVFLFIMIILVGVFWIPEAWSQYFRGYDGSDSSDIISEYNERFEKVQDSVNSLIERLKEQNYYYKGRFSNFQDTVHKKEDRLRNRITTLEQKIQANEIQRQRLEEMIARSGFKGRARGKIKELECSVQELRKESIKYQKELGSLRALYRKKEQVLHREIDKLKRKIGKTKQRKVKAQERIDNLAQTLKGSDGEERKVQLKEIKALRNLVQKLRSANLIYERKLVSLSVTSKKSENTLRDKVVALQKEIEKITKESKKISRLAKKDQSFELIRNKEKEISGLQNQIRQLQERSRYEQKKIASLESRRAEDFKSQKDIMALRQEIARLKNDKVKLAKIATGKDFQKGISKQLQKIDKLESRIQKLQEQDKYQELELSDFKVSSREAKRFQKKIEALLARISNLKVKKQKLERAIAVRAPKSATPGQIKKLKVLNDYIKKLTEEKQYYETKLVGLEIEPSQGAKLKAQLARASELETRLETMRRQNAYQAKKLLDMKAALRLKGDEKFEDQIDSLEHQIKKIKAEKEKAQKEIAYLNKSLERGEGEKQKEQLRKIQKLQKHAQELKQQNFFHEKKLENLRNVSKTQEESLQGEIAILQKEIVNINGENEQTEKRIRELQRQTEPATGEMRKGQLGKIAELETHAQTLRTKGRKYKEKLANLYSILQDKKNLVAKKAKQDILEVGQTHEDALKQKVTLNYSNADLAQVLRTLSEGTDINIIAGPKVKGRVTVHLKDIPLETALNSILLSNGYTYVKENDILRVISLEEMKRSPMSATVVKVFTLKYADANNVRQAISRFLSEYGSIQTFSRTTPGKSAKKSRANILIIRDTSQVLANIEQIIVELDKEPYQVLIEAKVIDLIYDGDDQMGIDWTVTGTLTGATVPTTLPFSNRRNTIGTDIVPDAGGTTALFPGGAGGIGLTGIGKLGTDSGLFSYGTISFANLQALLQFIETHDKSNLLSAPHIATLDGEEASINVGEIIPIPTYERNSETGTIEITGYQELEVGVILRVTPYVMGDEKVMLVLHPEVSELTDRAVGPNGERPIVTVRQAKTTVNVRDGETVVIGGLLKDNIVEDDHRVPFLGDIPFLGAVFRYTSKSVDKRELLIFVTPHIIREANFRRIGFLSGYEGMREKHKELSEVAIDYYGK
ncbi:MAG: secretin and TonB N-terminal domain-containing protein [Omnitrophica bacterium]|nr:secretin and TonB N-terminal domain-containing protein [Candidatus Omnitrophota bacterium]